MPKFLEENSIIAKENSINFLKISLDNAFNISLKTKITFNEYFYIFKLYDLIEEFYCIFNEDKEVDRLYHRAIEMFSRVLSKKQV